MWIDASDERSEGKWKFGYSELKTIAEDSQITFRLENHAAIESNKSSANAEWSDENKLIPIIGY